MNNLTPLFEVETILPILSQISIFGGFNSSQLYNIFRILQRADYRAGDYIFTQGEAPTHIYIILEGHVKMVEEVEGSSYQLFEFGQGNCIGEDSLIGIHTHSLSAIAVDQVRLAVIPRKSLLDFYNTDKDLFSLLILNVAREISRRLRATDNLLLHYIDKVSHPE